MVAAIGAKNCLSRSSCFLWTLFSQRRENTTGLQYVGHWTSRKTLRKHSRLYLSLLWVFSKPENHPGCILCSLVHPVTSSLLNQHHLVVGHTLKYIVSKNEVNQTDGSRDIGTFVSPLSLNFQSDHYQLIHLKHGLRTDTDTTTTHSPVCPGHCRHYCQCTDSKDSIHKPACLWLELPRCIPFLLHILPYPGELAPPQLHSTRQGGPPQVYFCSPRHQIPRDACTMDANWQQRGTEGDQGQSFCLPRPYPAGNDTWCQYPCASWRIGRNHRQARRGPPRSCCTHQDPGGLLRDDQQLALQAWTTLSHCPCIPPWGKAARKTYGQAIQDTLQWAGWHCCEPLCHPTGQGTSLSQLQTCGCNLPGQKADSPHQPQQPWSYTLCTLQGLSQLHLTAPSWQSKLPSMWLPLFQMWQNGTLGTQMLWWQATPIKECTSTWVTAEEVQCPPRNHNTCQGAEEQDRCHRHQRGPQPSRWDSPTPHPTQHNNLEHSPRRDHGQRCTCPTMQWGLHHHPAAWNHQQKGNSLTLC